MTPYEYMLDLFPLVEEISSQNPVLGAVIQATALELLNPDLDTLLQLATDLGYVSEEVVSFLKRGKEGFRNL